MPKQLKDACVVATARLADAMKSLESSSTEIVLVTDTTNRLVGVLTDGDIRRALLGGANLDSPLDPHIQRRFTAVTPLEARAEVLDLMHARSISQIPIINDAGQLVGLHLLHQLIGSTERPNWAVIMAGGKGTRLRPLTNSLPKPMLRVAGRPILERLVLHLVGSGIRRIFLSINYLGHIVKDHFGNGDRFGCRIDYLEESAPLGTGGPLALLPESCNHPVIVLNGDIISQISIADILSFHQSIGPLATIAVREYIHAVPFGCLDVDGDRIVQLAEKPVLSQLINAGIYVMEPELVTRIPKAREFPITDLFKECLSRGERLSAFKLASDWIDVGQREQLMEARGESV